MFRLTLTRAMHDRKIPNITRTRKIPPVLSSYDSPKKFDRHKHIKEEPSIWKRLWPKFRVHSQQYRQYGLMPIFYTSEDIKLGFHDMGSDFRAKRKIVVTVPQRGYKATHGDGRPIASWNRQPLWEDADATGTSVKTPKPHEHAEAEEEAIWGEINHDYTDIDGVESELKGEALTSFKKLFKKKTT